MKMAPSTPTLSIAATISSPVTWGGQLGTLCQGRFGVFASYAWTCESMMGMSDNLPQPCVEVCNVHDVPSACRNRAGVVRDGVLPGRDATIAHLEARRANGRRVHTRAVQRL